MGTGVLGILTLIFIMKFPDVAIEYMQRGLELSVRVVIPSLFPFMVVSELIVISGVISYLAKPLDKLSRRIFGIGTEGTSAFIAAFRLVHVWRCRSIKEGIFPLRICKGLFAFQTIQAPHL